MGATRGFLRLHSASGFCTKAPVDAFSSLVIFKTLQKSKYLPRLSGSRSFPPLPLRTDGRPFLSSGRDPIHLPFLTRSAACVFLRPELYEAWWATSWLGRGAHASGAAGCASGARARPLRCARRSRGPGLVLSNVPGALSPRGGTRTLRSVRHCGAFSQFLFK